MTALGPTATTKHCRRCAKTKPTGEFYRARMKVGGLTTYCKPCERANSAQTRINRSRIEALVAHLAATPPRNGGIDLASISLHF